MDEDEAYQKNTKEQYEMLGRFVAAFEHMVNNVRQYTISIAGGGCRGDVPIAVELRRADVAGMNVTRPS